MDTEEFKTLCCYQYNDCEGYVTFETAWRDEHGTAWDTCKPCAEHERAILDGRR